MLKFQNNISMSRSKQTVINIIAQIVAFTVNIGISFFLSRYIINAVGAEAYGFVSLSFNIVNYISILSIALNSMSSRFVAISIFRNDYRSANQYYTSTFVANFIGVLIFIVPSILFISRIDSLFNVSAALTTDVRALLGFLFLNFFIGLLCTNLNISFYVTNRLYLSSLISTAGYIIRAMLLLFLFMNFNPHIAFIGLVSLVITCFTNVMNLYYKKKLIPSFTLKKESYRFSRVIELIKSGIWNSITQLGDVLSNGLDLLISNLFISALGMGVLAISKTIPSVITSVLVTLASIFVPTMTNLYAKEKHNELVLYIKQSMKIIGVLINIPIAILIAYGDTFFRLWVPTQDSQLLQILSIITVLPWAIIGPASIIHNIFAVVNKLKMNSLLVCFTGLLNVGIVFVLLKTTSLGLFAVAGVSSTLSIVRNLLYTVPFGAKYLGEKWTVFFPEVGKSTLSVIIISVIGLGLKREFNPDRWITLAIFAVITGILGLIFNYYIVINKIDRAYISGFVKRKLNIG